jgi:hypothetical protein
MENQGFDALPSADSPPEAKPSYEIKVFSFNDFLR